MSSLSRAARAWLSTGEVPGEAAAAIVTLGIAAGRRTAVAHYIADAAEITVDGETTLAARWLCGGSSVDAYALEEEHSVECVNCRLAAAIPRGPLVYFAWDADDELLYVGSTINPVQRLRAHATQSKWWVDVHRLSFEAHGTETEARRAELEHIQKRPGKHNRERPSKLQQTDAVLRLIGGESA